MRQRRTLRKRKTVVKSVISDLGKVILFFDNDIFFRKISRHSAFSFKKIKELAKTHFVLVEDFDRGRMTPQQFYLEVTKRFEAEISFETFYAFYTDVFSLNRPVLNILKSLKTKYRLILLSNTDIMRFGFIREKFPEIFFFDDYILSYEVGYMKPHPKIYHLALERAKAKPEECLFIDDMEENIVAAQSLGIISLCFTPQTDIEEALRNYGLSF